jgi:hypothetical protein
MNRVIEAFVIGTLAVVVSGTGVATADLGPASDAAGCVGEFSSTGGTQLGSTFGTFIAETGARGFDRFGLEVVSVQARGDQPNCPIPIEILPLP